MHAAPFLREYYGERFNALPADEQQALAADVQSMLDEDGFPSYRLAIQELDRRIGNALESYAECIAIAFRRSQ